MIHQATVTYNRQIIKKAVGHFWRRFIAWHGFLAISLSVLSTVALLVAGNRSWLVGALDAAFFLLALSTGVYLVFLRRSLWKFERMPSKSVLFNFSEEHLSTASDLGNSNISWRAIERIWRFPDVWLLFVAKTTYITLPLADVDQKIQTFIVDRVVRHGGQIA